MGNKRLMLFFVVSALLLLWSHGWAGSMTIATGSRHTIILKEEGTLWAWGDNTFGQLGDGTSGSYRHTPYQIRMDADWASIAAGSNHTVAIKADGSLWAWGANSSGQLGDNTTSNKTTPIRIGTATDWFAIAAGGTHTVALKKDGSLWAWGANSAGQLGDGTNSNRTTPVRVGTATDWIAISAGNGHTMSLKADGSLWAWGANNAGQLGDGLIANRNAPARIAAASSWAAIAAGHSHSVALKTDGSLWAWGSNNYGQLGVYTNVNSITPTQIGMTKDWAFIEAGASHTVAIKTDGSLWTWGLNNRGQLGINSNIDKYAPVPVGTANDWTAIAVGELFTVALKSDGSLWNWGDNASGQLGNATLTNNSAPVRVKLTLFDYSVLFPLARIQAGVSHTVAIKTDGSLWAWGLNTFGQLGDGTTIGRITPVRVGTANDWAAAAAGLAHTVALKQDGTLWSWGLNGNGQLGDSTNVNKSAPVRIGSDNNWVAVVAGDYHVLAIKADGSLWSWGLNTYGQLGNDTTTDRNTPGMVGMGGVWATVAAGKHHTVAITTDGSLWAWGLDNHGQLGDESTSNKKVPVRIGMTNDWAAVTAGEYHSAAIKRDGSLWAWGLNSFGQLGNGSTVSRPTPGLVGADMDWAAIAAGWNHTIAMKKNGTLWAWGDNLNGQLGDGSMTSTPATTPIQVGTATSWTAFTTGGHHNVALRIDGSLWAWGLNNYGQIGDNSTTSRPSPVQIGRYEGVFYYCDTDLDSYANIANDGMCSGAACPPVGCQLTPGNDCNDPDMWEYPNQTWYKDMDNDGFATGQAIVSCTRPPGYKAAAELAGFQDCNDSSRSVRPGGGEICNDKIDNDCNGLIDEADTTCTSHAYFFPSIKDDEFIGWANFLTVQAKDAVPMDVTIRVYDMAGTPVGTYIYSNTNSSANGPAIAPNARVAQRPCIIKNLTSNICITPVEGSMIVETNVPAIATTNAMANFFKGFSIYEAAKARSVHNFPKAFDGPNAYQVYMLAQNSHGWPINVTAELFGKTQTSPGHGVIKTFTIPAYGTLKFRPSEMAGNIDFSGSVVVTSDGAKAGDGLGPAIPAMCRYELGAEALDIYESTVPQPTLYFPTVKDGMFGTLSVFQNYLSVVNSGTTSVTVDVILYTNAGVKRASTGPVVIPAGGKNTWRPSMILGTFSVPIDFEGSVVVTSTGPIVGQTNTMYPGNNIYQCDAFNLFESALPTPSLLFPKAFDNLAGDGRLYSNFVYVQNPDDKAKNIKIEQFNNNGTANGARTVTLGSNATYVFRPKDLVTDGTYGFRGSVKVTETSGLPISGAIKYEIQQSIMPASPVSAITIYRSMGM